MALALSLGVGSVQAADFKSYVSSLKCGTSTTLVDEGDIITKSLEYAVEQFGTTDTKLEMPFRVRYTLTANLSNDFYVTYTLSGGPTWGSNLTTASFTIQNADGNLASTAPLVAIVKGGKDTDSTVSFIVQANKQAATTAHILDFQFTVGKAQKALANYGQINISADVRLASSTDPAAGKQLESLKTLPLATSIGGANINISPPNPNSGAYISVAGDGKIFEGPEIDTTTAVDYGTIEISGGNTTLKSTSEEPIGGTESVVSDKTCVFTPIKWSPCDDGILKSVGLTISDGNFAASTVDKIFIKTKDTTIPATEKLSDNIAAKWTITESTPLEDLCKSSTQTIMLNVDGVTEINENRKVPPTGTLTVTFDGGKVINSSTRLRHLKKNGSVCTLYNIPNSTALDRLNIRITNDSTTVSGFVKGTLRGEDGNDIFKSAMLIPADGLVPNQTVHLDSAAIIAAAVAAGKTEWTGRAVLTVESNIPEGSMEVYGLLRAATQPLPTFTDSPLMNMSVGTTGDGCD